MVITRKATAERQTVMEEGDRDRRKCVRSEVEVRFKREARTDAADHANQKLGGNYPVLLARDSGGDRQRHVLVGRTMTVSWGKKLQATEGWTHCKDLMLGMK